MNWTGLLKWSLAQHDGTKECEIPQLSEDQKVWLKEAMESCVIDEVKEMKVILKTLESKIKDSEISEDVRSEECVELIEGLIDLLVNSDSGINFCKIGGPILMFDCIFDPNISENVKIKACRMISESTQNNHFVQDFISKLDFWKLMAVASSKTVQKELALASISALSAILKGNNMVNKRVFVNNNGIEFIKSMIINSTDDKILAKTFSILSDLLYFKEHMAYDALIIQNQNDKLALNPELKMFVDKIEDHENEIFEQLKLKFSSILTDKTPRKQFLRFTYIDCIKAMFENQKKENKYSESLWKPLLIDLRILEQEFEKLSKKDDFYETEYANLKTFFY